MTPVAFDSAPYAIQVTAVEPTRQETKEMADKRAQGTGTHVTRLVAADEQRERWSAPLFGCFSSCVPNCCLVAFCPCISLAQIDARLGGSFEMAVMGFGMLVTGLVVCFGLFLSAVEENRYTEAAHTEPAVGVHSVAVDGYHPPERHVPREMVVATAVAVALVLVLAVARLRVKTRKQMDLAGSTAQDLALSLACCPCIIAQMATQLDTYSPGVCSLASPLDHGRERDVLPAYMVTPHA
jgi:Cys-rich protein (TIGR01571 family)